jgi:hypothetical protein
METAGSVIKSALQEILVQASESPIEADEAQDALVYLNRLMSMYDADGINLGYTAVTSLASPITVADGAIMGIVKNLAVTLFPQFSAPGTQINPILIQEARDGLKVMEKLGVFIIPTSYPDTLPIGSGNEWDSGWNDHFYSDAALAVTTEQGGFIAVEDGTELP